jgi:RES domain
VPALYRVFPYVKTAPDDGPGGARYIPPQGGGRIDNPDLYSVLYLSDAAAGAIAEALGRFPEWTAAVLKGSPSLPGSTRAIARYALADREPVCNLDNARQLLALHLRPSDVVTRDYVRSRGWAKRIYEARRWSGVRWWSYYDPRWASLGLWHTSRLTLEEVVVLRLDSPVLLEAGRTIMRPVLTLARR